jgi:hypothetical protein
MLVVVTAQELTRFDTEVPIAVFNPTPGGGTSDPLKVALEPKETE